MTVQEMIDALSALPRDLEIIIGSDDEGNDWNAAYTPQEAWCVADHTRCGYSPVHPDDIGTEYEESELVKMVVM